ncbi:hypothetical protein GE09DRAFT_1060097 [Coniochaeta sp. 2T2.1]|nr:hypothetical protein GE09DRAFT_1060097 [Coniochaeta sp. 2T2.1]
MSVAPTVDKLTLEQQAQALQKIQDNNIRQSSTASYVEDVKHSLLFRPGFNWNDILSAAPVSLTLMSSLFVASTVPDATQIKIIAPKGGFKTLANFGDDASLNACLIQCSDAGVQAYTTAADSFDIISLKSGTIKETVNNIVAILGDPESARTGLAPAVQVLSDVSKACETNAVKMQDTVQHWLDMVCEVHVCVVQTSQSTAEKETANQVAFAAARVRLGGAEEGKKLASSTVEQLKDSLKTATDSYKKAADNFPSGWDLVAQQFVSDLSQTFTSAINQAVPALIENYGTMAKVKEAVDIFKGDQGGAKGGSLGDKPEPVDHSGVQPATQAPDPVPSAVPPYPNDPAYGVIGLIRANLTTVQSFITGGADHGVDWDTLMSKDSGKANTGLGVMAALLDDARNGFKPSPDPPSQTLLTVFHDAKLVMDELQKVLDGLTTINPQADLPKANSPEVKRWQLTMGKATALAAKLETDATYLATPHSAPLINPTQAGTQPTDTRGAFRQQIIDAATTQLDMTAKVMQTTTDSFQKASDKLIDIQTKVGEIQGELAELKASKMNLVTIRALLVKCIDILVQLKTQVNRLVGFFSAVTTLVEHMVDDQVGPFIKYLESSTGVGPHTEASLLNFTFTDVQRQLIFNFSLSVRAYAELFRDIGGMYLDVHNKYISPGIQMVNGMQAEYSGGSSAEEKQRILDQRSAEVAKYNTDSVAGVKDLVQAQQTAITENLATKAKAAASALAFVPVRPAPAVSQAITDSAKTAADAATAGINASGKYITRKFSSTASLVRPHRP